MMGLRDGPKGTGGSLGIPLASPDVLGSLAGTLYFEKSSSPGTQFSNRVVETVFCEFITGSYDLNVRKIHSFRKIRFFTRSNFS